MAENTCRISVRYTDFEALVVDKTTRKPGSTKANFLRRAIVTEAWKAMPELDALMAEESESGRWGA